MWVILQDEERQKTSVTGYLIWSSSLEFRRVSLVCIFRTMANERNVYFGPDGLKQYFNPDSQPPLPLVELPEHLNPYYHDGVRIYAKMMTMHPANNVKAMPGTVVHLLMST